MATIKLSNESVISAAKQEIKVIQQERHNQEQKLYAKLSYEYDKVPTISWFVTRPILSNVWDYAQYLSGDELEFYNGFGVYSLQLYSTYKEKAHETCVKLKCMAENNEDDFMTITREEAVELGVC